MTGYIEQNQDGSTTIAIDVDENGQITSAPQLTNESWLTNDQKQAINSYIGGFANAAQEVWDHLVTYANAGSSQATQFIVSKSLAFISIGEAFANYLKEHTVAH